MSVLFESEWLDFSLDSETLVVVNHNLGTCPRIIGFFGRNSEGEELGFPVQLDEEGNQVESPKILNTTDLNSVSVYKSSNYTAASQFKIKIFS